MGFFTNLMGRISKTGRTLRRKEYNLQKSRMEHSLAEVNEALTSRDTEDPREQAFQRSSMFARGLGKSSINEQEGTRLTGMQSRIRASLGRQRQLAIDGLDLLRKKRKYAKRIQWAQSVDDVIGLYNGGVTAYGMASAPAAGAAASGAGAAAGASAGASAGLLG